MLSAVGSYNAFNFTESVAVLRRDLPPGHETGTDDPRPRAARPRGLRGLPCRPGGQLVCPFKTFRLLSALFRRFQQISAAHPHAHQEPASRPRNLRAMSLAAKIFRQPGPHLQLFSGRRLQLAVFHPALDQNRRRRSHPRPGRRHSLAHDGGQPGGIHRHRRRPAENSLGADHRCQQGVVTVFRQPRFTNDISQYEIRTMDCMDCHNRPSHRYVPPDQAVNLAMELGQIDRTMPWIKTNAVYVLTRKYNTDAEARDGIATALAERYPNDPRIAAGHPAWCSRFTRTISFPEMKANWSVYPDNLGHMIWPGCFRCHDGNAQDRRRQANHQGQRLQRLPHHPGAGQRRGTAATDPGRPALQTSGRRL